MWQKISNYKIKLVNQILLFLNLYLSTVWFFSICVTIYHLSSEAIQLSFPLICFCIGFPVEILRLYLGYSGNLRNNVSWWLSLSEAPMTISIFSSSTGRGSRWLSHPDVFHSISDSRLLAALALRLILNDSVRDSNNRTKFSSIRNSDQFYYHS